MIWRKHSEFTNKEINLISNNAYIHVVDILIYLNSKEEREKILEKNVQEIEAGIRIKDRNNGTGVLVKYREEKYILTAGHVVKHFERLQKESKSSDAVFKVSNIDIDFNKDEVEYEVFDDVEEGDYAFIKLSDHYIDLIEKEKSKKLSDNMKSELFLDLQKYNTNYEYLLNEDASLILGYPGIIRIDTLNLSKPELCSFFGSLHDKREDYFFVQLKDENGYSQIGGERSLKELKPAYPNTEIDYGGVSGGPVFFCEIDGKGIPTYSLVGIVINEENPVRLFGGEGVKVTSIHKIKKKIDDNN